MTLAKQLIPAAQNPGPSLEDFEAHAFEVEAFDHEAHVYVAWSYLQRYDLLECIDRFRSTLIRLTTKLGIPDKYHETITWFYMIAVAEHATGDAKADWHSFREAGSDLFRQSPGLIQAYYSNERLWSDQARSVFLLPDLAMGA